jgi:glycosyltransferase involved in cell wall biosynthesis
MTTLYTILHQPGDFLSRSGMYPLVEALGACPVWYGPAWKPFEKRSWTIGKGVRELGCRWYGSTWNYLLPVMDEITLSRKIPRNEAAIVHFLWGEFAGPRSRRRFDRGGPIIGTFHASARRQAAVMNKRFCLSVYDGITVMSSSQVPFFIDRGIPESRIRVLLHGVDLEHFHPAPIRKPRSRVVNALLVGSTERDHAFLAEVCRRLPPDTARISVCTAREQQVHYRDTPHVQLLPFLDAPDMLEAYQQADLLIMPMLDCTANNAVLEAMACGTPVMANRIGGIPEYVDPQCNDVIVGQHPDDWVERLVHYRRHREELESRRPAVRRWAERFDWREITKGYEKFYQQCIAR